MAATTGLVAAGRFDEARRFLAAATPALPEALQGDPALRLLGVLAQGEPLRQAAAR